MISFLEKNPKLSWTITAIIAAAIFYISSITFPPGQPGIGIKAIIYHIAAFFALTFILSISLIKGKRKELIPIIIVMSILYAISDELHQFFVPGRTTSLNDIFLDTVGITFALLIYSISLLYRSNFTTKKNNKMSKSFINETNESLT